MGLRTRTQLAPEDRAKVIAALKAGGEIRSVAAAFGIHRETVRRLRNDAKLGVGRSQRARQVLTVRVSPDEAQVFAVCFDRAGYRNRSDALRALIRLAAGLLEPMPAETAELDRISEELRRIGVNVNQMTRLANSGRLPMNRQTAASFAELTRVLGGVTGFLEAFDRERRRRGLDLFARSGAADG